MDCQLGLPEISLAYVPSLLKGPHGDTEYSALSESGGAQMQELSVVILVHVGPGMISPGDAKARGNT